MLLANSRLCFSLQAILSLLYSHVAWMVICSVARQTKKTVLMRSGLQWFLKEKQNAVSTIKSTFPYSNIAFWIHVISISCKIVCDKVEKLPGSSSAWAFPTKPVRPSVFPFRISAVRLLFCCSSEILLHSSSCTDGKKWYIERQAINHQFAKNKKLSHSKTILPHT